MGQGGLASEDMRTLPKTWTKLVKLGEQKRVIRWTRRATFSVESDRKNFLHTSSGLKDDSYSGPGVLFSFDDRLYN